MTCFQYNVSIYKQRGVAFILFFVLLVVGFGIFILQTSSNDDQKNEEQTRKALLEAKEALISFAVATIFNDGTNNDMGRLPWPDRNTDVSPSTCPGRYDGRGDFSPTNSLAINLMLGRFPWWNDPLGDPCVGGTQNNTVQINMDLHDASGERLWYAVSPYLVRSPNLAQIAFEPIPLADPANTNWLTVLIHDSNGNVIQTVPNVAFVIIAPGPSLNGQNRNGLAPAAIRYLDTSFGISNFDTSIPFNFVMAPKSDTFNDVLVYVTRNELVAAVYKRLFNEVRSRLITFYNIPGNNFYPFAGNITGECEAGRTSGWLATADVDADCVSNIINAMPANINNAWLNDITYNVNPTCTQTPPPTADCNNIPGVVTLGSSTFGNITDQLP